MGRPGGLKLVSLFITRSSTKFAKISSFGTIVNDIALPVPTSTKLRRVWMASIFSCRFHSISARSAKTAG